MADLTGGEASSARTASVTSGVRRGLSAAQPASKSVLSVMQKPDAANTLPGKARRKGTNGDFSIMVAAVVVMCVNFTVGHLRTANRLPGHFAVIRRLHTGVCVPGFCVQRQ